jgi:hypothetical protein
MLGIPNDTPTRSQYCFELIKILKLVHGLELAHLDCLPCNIAWREVGGSLEMKLLDWDSASEISQPFSENIRTHHLSRDVHDHYWPSFFKDYVVRPQCDAWYVFLYGKMMKGTSNISVNNPHAASRVTQDFKIWISELNLDELDHDFHQWYQESW